MSSKPPIYLLRPSSAWVTSLPESDESVDVSGWDQDNFEEAWTEPISWPEFLNRLLKSKRMQKLFQVDETGLVLSENESQPDGLP